MKDPDICEAKKQSDIALYKYKSMVKTVIESFGTVYIDNDVGIDRTIVYADDEIAIMIGESQKGFESEVKDDPLKKYVLMLRGSSEVAYQDGRSVVADSKGNRYVEIEPFDDHIFRGLEGRNFGIAIFETIK